MATQDLRFFQNPETPLLPDGHPRRGMSVVAALSEWLIHTNRRVNGSWTQRYEHGIPVTDLEAVDSDKQPEPPCGSNPTRPTARPAASPQQNFSPSSPSPTSTSPSPDAELTSAPAQFDRDGRIRGTGRWKELFN
jgi:hypothetical protein